MRLREIVKLWARVSFGKPPGAKFVAKDGLNAVTTVAPRVDRKYGTNYAANVEAYRKHLQKNDLAFAMGLTDIKGDRSLRPSEQKQHQDFYVRIVEEREDGIIVSGAKTHISQAPACNEVLIAPCRAMKEDDAAYAVAFGIELNAPGITMICAQPEIHEGVTLFDNPISGAVYINDATIIFDNVFIPNERIFLKGEWEFAGEVAYMFANFHRLSAETYKAMELELFTGAAALMADYNGIAKKAHVREKLTWLVMYTEAVETLGKAAVEHCRAEEGSDLVYPDPMTANICKFYFADNWHQATKYIQDIGGGIIVTAPSSKDYYNPATHDLMEKYFAGQGRRADRAPPAHGQAHPRPHLGLRGRADDPRRGFARGAEDVHPADGGLGPVHGGGEACRRHPRRREERDLRGAAAVPAEALRPRRRGSGRSTWTQHAATKDAECGGGERAGTRRARRRPHRAHRVGEQGAPGGLRRARAAGSAGGRPQRRRRSSPRSSAARS